MYEFLCGRVIPGCTHKESGPDRDEVHQKAMEHMSEYHSDDHPVEENRDKFVADAMIFLPR